MTPIEAIREALAAQGPIGNMVDFHTRVQKVLEQRRVWDNACNPSAIAALLTAHDAALARAEAVRAEVIEECAAEVEKQIGEMNELHFMPAAIRSLVRRDGGEKQG